MKKIDDIVSKIGNGALPHMEVSQHTIRQLTIERLDDLDPNHHPKVRDAIAVIRNWDNRRKAGQINSMVITSTPVRAEKGAETIYKNNCTGYGCGKTHMARAMMWAECFAVDGQAVAPRGKFMKAIDLINLLGEGERMREILNTWGDMETYKPHVFVIDDVGAEGTLRFVPKEAQQEELHARYYQVIDYCYMNQIAVVLTANLSLLELQERLGGRSWSRIMAMCPKGFVRDLTGVPDYRLLQGGRGLS